MTKAHGLRVIAIIAAITITGALTTTAADAAIVSPTAPTGLSVVVNGATTTASWQAPTSNGGQPIVKYTVQKRHLVPNAVWGLWCVSATTTCATATPTKASEYRINASNGLKISPWSTVVVATVSLPAAAISSGFANACAIISGETVKCWGYNDSGELGNATNTDSNIPVNVTGITTAVAISNGQFHSCAIISGGTVKCWGGNTFGQLGNATNTDSNIPVTVTGIP